MDEMIAQFEENCRSSITKQGMYLHVAIKFYVLLREKLVYHEKGYFNFQEASALVSRITYNCDFDFSDEQMDRICTAYANLIVKSHEFFIQNNFNSMDMFKHIPLEFKM